ncbi:MAG: VWA domain-containing protein, partial [Polyangiaceae bacterium]|nr:VWA domain-containing protein [Polyangiaceae bacterium]
MTLVFTAALAIALLIAAPIAAHLLHVHRAQKTPFPPTHLVPPSPATHKHTRKLEHRYLLLVRLLAILALTLLGTSPLLTCSRLSISRDGGASIALAIVVDDSMSMRVRDDPSDALSTRFARAKQDAVDLLSGLRDGDSVAIILAGDPVRIALAPSTNLATAKQTLDQIAPSDRATDLDSAIAIASSLVAAMPQPQHQIVVLTDRCDGNPDGPPLGHNATVPIWIVDRPATQPTAQPSHDCAVLRAEERSGRVIAKVACTGPRQDSNRSLVARGNGKELARVALQTRMSDDDHEVEIDLALPTSTFADHVALEDGADSIP